LYPNRLSLTKKIGARLRAARHAQGLSLAALAARTNTLSKSRISNYEQGIRRMGIEEATELAEALGGITPSYLLCIDNAPSLTLEEERLVGRYRTTDQRGRETILRVADAQGTYSIGEGGTESADTEVDAARRMSDGPTQPSD
jgi:transcriptional regulator with XRE-family HTH domain